MSPRGLNTGRQDTGNRKATNEDASKAQNTNLDEDETCTSGSCCGKCNCTCKDCRCSSRTKRQIINPNRTTYGNEGGYGSAKLTIDMSKMCLQAESYSSTDSFPANNIPNDQAAPTPPALPVHSLLHQHVRSYEHEDMTRTRQMLTDRYYNETIWNRRPWMNATVRDGISERSVDLSGGPPSTFADSMDVNTNQSNMEQSFYSTPSSRIYQNSLADTELIFGTGDGFDEQLSHFLILSPKCSHSHYHHY